MAIVQFQRFNSRGKAVEVFSRDVANHREYLDTIEPLDRRARVEDGSTLTVAEGAPKWIGAIPEATERDREDDRVRWQTSPGSLERTRASSVNSA